VGNVIASIRKRLALRLHRAVPKEGNKAPSLRNSAGRCKVGVEKPAFTAKAPSSIRELMLRSTSSPTVARQELILHPNQLVVASDGHSIGAIIVNHDESSQQFLLVEQISAYSLWNPLDSRLRVRFSADDDKLLLDGARAVASPDKRAPICRFFTGWRLCIAWMVNMSALTLIVCGLLYLGIRSRGSKSELSATGQSDDIWWQAVTSALLTACLESYLLMDAIKVAMFTVTASYLVDRFLPRGTKLRSALQKPLKKLHVAIDAIA